MVARKAESVTILRCEPDLEATNSATLCAKLRTGQALRDEGYW